MALIRGIHCLAHGNLIEARHIAEDIQRNQRLLVGSGTWGGSGVYAWYPEHFPYELRNWPQVLFEVDDKNVIAVTSPKTGIQTGYFRIPGAIGDYVSIRVIAFKNVWNDTEA